MLSGSAPTWPARTGEPRAGGGLGRAAAGPSFNPNPFSRFGLLDQLFIIRAIVLRDVRVRHQRTRVGFLVEFIQPTIVLIIHYYVFSVLGRIMPAKIPVQLFVLGGFTVWFVYSHTARRNTRREEGPGAMPLPGVTPLHFVIAAAVWECAAMIALLFAGLAVSALVCGDGIVPNLALAIVIYPISALLGTGSRLIFEALARIWPSVRDIKRPLVWLLFITSGIYFSASGNTYDLLAQVSWYNPLLHIIEIERYALYPGYPIFRVTLVYPIAWGLGLTLLGLVLDRCIAPRTQS